MRFVAPRRGEIDPGIFTRPPLLDWADSLHLLQSEMFPDVAALNAGWEAGAREGWSFVEQTPKLLADGLHYESRIHAQRRIATRADNWHDLFNALVWRRHAPLKSALNARQVGEIDIVGAKQRSRAQCALTHFDEGGVIVVVRDTRLLEHWDRHDWHALFWRERAAWNHGHIEAHVFGHALLEMALDAGKVITGKALAICVSGAATWLDIRACIAAAIRDGAVLNDPQELRPLPISGIPGWHPGNARESFYAQAPCFRPVRAGRVYPPALLLDSTNRE